MQRAVLYSTYPCMYKRVPAEPWGVFGQKPQPQMARQCMIAMIQRSGNWAIWSPRNLESCKGIRASHGGSRANVGERKRKTCNSDSGYGDDYTQDNYGYYDARRAIFVPYVARSWRRALGGFGGQRGVGREGRVAIDTKLKPVRRRSGLGTNGRRVLVVCEDVAGRWPDRGPRLAGSPKFKLQSKRRRSRCRCACVSTEALKGVIAIVPCESTWASEC